MRDPVLTQDNALSPTGAAGLYTTPQRRTKRRCGFEERNGGPSGGFCKVGGQERRHGVGGVAIEAVAGAVVPACGPGVGVAHGVLYVTQRHAGVERSGAASS